jgi:HK97 family phage portal protein
MGFWSTLLGVEYKSDTGDRAVRRSEAEIDARIAAEDASGLVSVVHACLSVIAEGVALPPVYVQRTTPNGRVFDDKHPLHRVITQKPNLTQTSYEVRETIVRNAALHGDGYAWINRARDGEILEIVPLRPNEIGRVDPLALGARPTYTVNGKTFSPDAIWHFKGPSADRHGGIDIGTDAQRAVNLTVAAEAFGTDLFKNRAALEGIISLDGAINPEQLDRVRESFKARNTGDGKRGRTAFFPAQVKYQPLSATATDSQWIETRRYQIEEICRFFRVSPTKVFSTLGSQSYASVEQAHIAHDQDTDAHWHARFMQSATRSLLSDDDQRRGYSVVIDNRDYLRGTAVERATYYNAGITGGWLTKNEVREAEGYPRSSDPEADKLTPAANLFGDTAKPSDAPAK